MSDGREERKEQEERRRWEEQERRSKGEAPDDRGLHRDWEPERRDS